MKTKSCEIYPTNQLGYDATSEKYYVNLYVAKNKKEYIVYVACDDYDVEMVEPKNLTIQFLNNADANPIEVPYDAEMFEDIEMDACIIFQDIKEEMINSTAV